MSKTFINPEGITLKNIKDILKDGFVTVKYKNVIDDTISEKKMKVKHISFSLNNAEDDIEVEFSYIYGRHHDWHEFNLKDIVEIRSENEEEISNGNTI